MFTGIIEEVGVVEDLKKDGSNLHITIKVPFAHELKIDQSIAHNGACLTVTEIHDDDTYTVTAIDETLQRTNFKHIEVGDKINLERSVKAGSFLDGHIVQGHVDITAVCAEVKEADGSWLFSFKHEPSSDNITVEKGSICVNGVSLTVAKSFPDGFSVAIIPYTYEHTNFKNLRQGDLVNIEFDILGKYVAKLMGERDR